MGFWMNLWLVVSAALMYWDAGFVLNRPRTIPGGDLFWLYEPYELYVKVDKLYSIETLNSGDGFAAAQSYLNLAEASMQILTVILWARASTSRSGDVLGLITQTMTFWKSCLYWVNDFMRPEEMRYTDPSKDLQQYILIFFIPNVFWIVCPFVIMIILGTRLATSAVSSKRKGSGPITKKLA
eukprot:gene20932-27782_t